MADPRVAVVIPIYRQPSLAVEAIESALRQKASFDYRIVLVNDGCPFTETDQTCRSYANAFPDRIRYVHRRNGGLSAARNTGIDVALRAWPSVEAIHFLDADDRMGPQTLELARAALQSHPEASWAYPNCRRFGSANDYVMMNGPWSGLELIAQNYVVCSSTIRRSVFDRGLRYDETLRLGYEDWDLWMQCIRAGLRGVHVPEIDFQYRSRAESMLTESSQHHEAIVAHLRRKHGSWFTPRRALELEHEEIPRYAIYIAEEGRVLLTSDPHRAERFIPLEELSVRLARFISEPRLVRFPHIFVVTSAAFMRSAAHGRFGSGVFWLLQNSLEQSRARIVVATLRQRLGTGVTLAVSPQIVAGQAMPKAAVAVMSTQTLHEHMTEHDGRAMRDSLQNNGEPVVESHAIQCAEPDAMPDSQPDALEAFAALLDEVGPEYRALARVCVTHGKSPCRTTGDASEATRKIFGAGPTFPSILDRSRIQIGYVLPVCRFGGAERATMNFGRESRRHGWVPHLFVIGSGSANLLTEFRETFASITVVEPQQLCRPDRLLGLLGTMDVVVNNLCAQANEVMGLLRRQGVKTLCHLHSVIISSDRMPCGQAYEVLRYEHSIDGVIVISNKLRHWCRAWGVPEAKLVYVPNAPSFDVSEALIKTVLEERSDRSRRQPLNVLYLGRFDWEKGMDRLLALCNRTAEESLPVQWRIVGGRVCGQEGLTERDLESIKEYIQPPVLTATALSRLYAWADVVVMLSRFEGVPLTILEAQRFGCVVLTTNVGAIEEIVDSGRTGFLFSNDLDTGELVDQIVQCLRGLHEDRVRLLGVARAGAELRRNTTWSSNFEPFARFVESLVGARGVSEA